MSTITLTLTRKGFLRQLAGGGLAMGLGACGGGDGGDPPPPTAASGCTSVNFSANHGHALTIPRADLDSTTAKTYSIQGAGLHDHLVTLSPAQLAQLKAGQVVSVASTESGLTPHTHDMVASCA
jgi:hypothetical protein